MVKHKIAINNYGIACKFEPTYITTTNMKNQNKSNTELEHELWDNLGKAQVKLFGGVVALSWALVGLVLVYAQSL
jgi:hypothetical protein